MPATQLYGAGNAEADADNAYGAGYGGGGEAPSNSTNNVSSSTAPTAQPAGKEVEMSDEEKVTEIMTNL